MWVCLFLLLSCRETSALKTLWSEHNQSCAHGSDWATCSRTLLRMIHHMLHWWLFLAQIQKKVLHSDPSGPSCNCLLMIFLWETQRVKTRSARAPFLVWGEKDCAGPKQRLWSFLRNCVSDIRAQGGTTIWRKFDHVRAIWWFFVYEMESEATRRVIANGISLDRQKALVLRQLLEAVSTKMFLFVH